eukprot:gene14660-20695_t
MYMIAGFPVMRYHSKDQSEKHRQTAFELALAVAASSPYARTVKRWVLIGVGTGGKVVATVGGNCRGTIAGFAFLSYPLLKSQEEAANGSKQEVDNNNNNAPSTSSPSLGDELIDLRAPVLFMRGQHDQSSSSAAMLTLVNGMKTWDVRLAELQGVDGNFCFPKCTQLRMSTSKDISNTVLDFDGHLQGPTSKNGSCSNRDADSTSAAFEPWHGPANGFE